MQFMPWPHGDAIDLIIAFLPFVFASMAGVHLNLVIVVSSLQILNSKARSVKCDVKYV